MGEHKIELSAKAEEIVKKFVETTGLPNDSRVIEECIFTVYDLLKLESQRSKTETAIPVEAFTGLINTFQRFGKVDYEY
jgi:hypothetical protein